jgi:NAD(P)-dependent dehydrogenase (short-subunit alcohol dehydrogenase family)
MRVAMVYREAGVIGLTKSLARELGRYEINVNCVCPGWIVPQTAEDAGEGSFWSGRVADTWSPEDLKRQVAGNAIRKLGSPWDIANMVAYLACDRTSYVTGQTISVDGGAVMI